MAQTCRICKVRKGSRHKMSCNYYKYNQPVVWVDTSGGTVTDTGSFNDYCDTSSSSSDSGSSSSCDSGSF